MLFPGLKATAVCTALACAGTPVLAPAQVPAQAGGPAYTSGSSHDKRHITYTVERDGRYVKDVELVRLVENEAGVRIEGQQVVPYSASLQSVEIVHARVITAEGQVIDVPASAILDQQPYLSQGAPAFSDVVAKAIVFPQVRPGARTDVHYRIAQKQPLLPGQFSAFEFASVHDVRRDVAYTVIAPAGMPMQVQGLDVPVERSTLPDGRVRWRAQTTNAVAIPPEGGSIAIRDYSQRFIASSLPSGQALARAYRELAGDRGRPTARVQALADSLTQGITEPRAQAQALYDWVRTHIRYVAIFLERGGWQPHGVDEILAAGYGDCKDKATLLGALLQAKGIASTPVLIDSGPGYWMPELPVTQLFNHMITYVPSLDLYLDATERWAPFGVLPREDAAKRVLHIATGTWATTPATPSAAQVLMRTDTAADGQVRGRVELRGQGAQTVYMGRSFSGMDALPDATLMPPLLAALQVKGAGHLVRGTPGRPRDPAELALEFSGMGAMDLPGPGALRLSAAPFSLVAGPLGTYQVPRRFPFPCPSFDLREEFDLTLPDTVKVLRPIAGLEQQAESDGARLRYTARTDSRGGRTTVIRTLTAEALKTVCTPEDQARWQPLVEAAQRNLRAQMLYD